ncbi:pilus assembly protein [Parvularcula flava]|uniref:Pilus assembly protein n=1 Tax=Aquisalinus luteolus TaxID=1566827 RepID=A0A8J3A1A6_9PROT|nr:TadE/TadG family type IV pilus assembly protein [Aquisalinus luteolus]NHK26543.1 pilus assembly protein [Aquisalinus luteolus]GGH92658.1 hypothetical protein GCM10011355_02670 [Aquisalinus luteolus]
MGMHPGRARHVSFRNDENGVAAVEFAIIANVFILLLTGLCGFGIYLSASHSMQQLAAEAARSAVGGIDQAEQEGLARTHIAAKANDHPFLKAEHIATTVTHPDSSVITITVSYDTSHLPVLNMLTGLSLPQGTMTATSSVRVGSIAP